MPLTKAEKQKLYRERKKQREGEAYLERERKRVKGYYVPIDEKSEKEKNRRRKKVKEHVQKHRERKKRASEAANNEGISNAVTDDQVAEITSSTDGVKTPAQPLIVKMPFKDQKKRTRKRTNRAVARCRREIERLIEANKNTEKKYKRVSKRYERLMNVSSPQSSANGKTMKNVDVEISSEDINPPAATDNTVMPDLQDNNDTPRKRTYSDLRDEGITPKKLPKIVTDKLVLANVITDEIKSLYSKSDEKGKAIISSIISSEKLKKYKLKKALSIKTGIRRHSLNRKMKNLTNVRKRDRNARKRNELCRDIQEFLQRDDNSRTMPGKNDKVKTHEGYVQKRVLNDSLIYLHMKYKAEKSSRSSTSFATFCKMRPKHIALTKFLSRNKCLCQKHQNMALALKTMKNGGADVSINPDDFSRKLTENNAKAICTTIRDEELSYQQWKKVDMPDGKKKTKIVERKLTKEEFVIVARQQVCEFQEQVQRVKTQYGAISTLKEKLPKGHVMLQMDFAENYTCNSADEVQSAYWNSTSVTLHPVVAYFRDDEDSLMHKNFFVFVYVSDDLGHNFGIVLTIIKNIVKEIKEIVTDLKMIHYWTDSPSSQYRNKTAFYVISDHRNLLGVPAIWNYFETGHGKGPCDGIGGTSKRTADLAIKQGKITVQDAMEFYDKVRVLHKSAIYRFVSSEEIEKVRAEIAEINTSLLPLKGTMQVHQVASTYKGKVKTSTTSCYCEECIQGNLHQYSEGLIVRLRTTHERDEYNEQLAEDEINRNDGNRKSRDEDITENTSESESRNVVVNDWVTVNYENDWHVGKVLCIDEEDELEISFIRPTKSLGEKKDLYKWPIPADILYVNRKDIITKIQEPNPVGRSGRSYRLQIDDYNKVVSNFFPVD